MRRLAVITSHPVQYYAPWFRHIAADGRIALRIFYLWDFGVRARPDPGFKDNIVWDIPILEGYAHEFVPNEARRPGMEHFGGLRNPALRPRVSAWQPDAALLIGYSYASMLDFLLRAGPLPLIFRGDSHRLAGEAAGWKESVKHRIRRFVFSRFRAFLPVGQANAEYFLANGVPREKLFFAPHCVENERFLAQATADAGRQWRRQWNIPADDRVVLFAGKFENKKRPEDLLEAFRRLSPERCHLVLVGSGAEGASLRSRTRDSSGTVHFVPFQNQSAMPAVYAASDVLVLPSFGNWETWGLAVNEAMACGVPAIVSSHVGCGPDLVRPGETGWIFPAGETGALEECLRDALSDDARRREIGKQAQRLVLQEYNYPRASSALYDAMDSVCR